MIWIWSWQCTTWQNLVQIILKEQDEATNFNAGIANKNYCKSFKYKGKLLGNTVAQLANGILRNATIDVPLKYLCNFWRSL